MAMTQALCACMHIHKLAPVNVRAILSHHKLIYHKYWKEGYVLFNDTLSTFYYWLYGVRHMVKNHSDSERGNLLLPQGLLFPINSKGCFICTISQTG